MVDKGFLCKDEDLSSIPITQVIQPGVALCDHNPRFREAWGSVAS